MRRMLTGNVIGPCLLLVLCLIQRGGSQLFRFCHRGVWHQLGEGDCPYGLLFNEQLQTPCYYTMGMVMGSENANVSLPRIWPNLCDEPYVSKPENATDATVGDGLFLAQKNGEIRMVQFMSSREEDVKTPDQNDLISLQSCEDRCFRGVYDDPKASPLYTFSSHESSDSLETPQHINRPKLSKNDIAAVRDQTLRLGDYLFDQIANPEENPGPKLRIVEIFKRSMKIMGKCCQHPFVSSNFLNRVLYAFLFLVSDDGVGEVEDIAVQEFEEIMVALNACDEKPADFRLQGTVCETNAIVKEVIKILPNGTEYTAPFQLTRQRSQKASSSKKKPAESDYEPGAGGGGGGEGESRSSSGSDRGQGSFPYDELDVFTEAAWSTIQLVHANCFATFKPNANMHHRYVSAMEQLFSGKIQDRWRNPTRLIDNKMWGTWFLADVDLTFMNLQACIRAAYLDAPFVMRLDRPIDPVRPPSLISLARSQSTNVGGDEPPPPPPAKSSGSEEYEKNKKLVKRRKRQASHAHGQQPQPDSYWETYTANGGIRYQLMNEVQCFSNPDDKEKAVRSLKDQCKVKMIIKG